MKLRIQATLGQAAHKIKFGGKPNPNLFQKEIEHTLTIQNVVDLINMGYFFIETPQYLIRVGQDQYNHCQFDDENEIVANILGRIKDDSRATFEALQKDDWECILTERERSYYNIPPEIELPLHKPEGLFR